MLKRLVGRDRLVGQHDFLGTTQLVLTGLERLVFFCQGCSLRAVEAILLSLEGLTSDFQSLVGRDGLVGQHDLSRPAFFSLSSLEGLGCGLQVDLLHAVKLVLASGKHLLAFLQGFLVLTVKRALRTLERLLSFEQCLLGFDRLVGKDGLLCTVELRLRSLEVLGCQVLASGEVLTRHAFACLEFAACQVLGCRELLLTQLQAEFVLLAHVGQARLVDGTHVGQGSVGVGLSVLLRDRRCAVDHGGDTGTGCHGAVDQSALGHILRSLRAGTLHQRAVFGQDRLKLTGRSLSTGLHFALLRGVLGGFCVSGVGHNPARDPAFNVERICHYCSTNRKAAQGGLLRAHWPRRDFTPRIPGGSRIGFYQHDVEKSAD